MEAGAMGILAAPPVCRPSRLPALALAERLLHPLSHNHSLPLLSPAPALQGG